MGRRKLEPYEKIARLTARKDAVKQAKLLKQDVNNTVFQPTITEIEGTVMKSKRGRKAKAKTSDVIDPSLFEDKDNIKTHKDINFFGSSKTDEIITVKRNLNVTKIEIKIENKVPWIEKYRPKNIGEIILDDQLKTKIENMTNNNILPNLIITGPPGTGKTSTIFCIAKKILGNYYKDVLLELNASDNRGLEIINNSIIHFCKKKINGNLTNDPLTGNEMKKIIIFDEADNITKKAQNVLANLMEEYTNNTRFCFTCNDSSQIIESIQSRCLILHYKPMDRENIKKKLMHICNKENVNYNNSGLEAIIFISQGDIRQAINNLEATHNSYDEVTEENVYKLCYQPHPNTIIALIQKCASKNIKLAIIKYEELKDQGYCNSDILQTMINVLKLISIDEYIRINFIKIISEIYLNVTDGNDSNLQMYSCLSKMINFITNLQQISK